MRQFLKAFDLKDAQLVVGISMLGYGLYLVNPASCFIVVGSIFIAPLVLPAIVGAWRTK